MVTVLADLPTQWDALAGPCIWHARGFLQALEASDCVGPGTGWAPCFLLAWRGDALAGALPLWLKTHSYGEYVFDWAWARAFQQHGERYYPKLLSAIPFTPSTGPRLMADSRDTGALLLGAVEAWLEGGEASSMHVLFPVEDELPLWQDAGYLLREGIQFHWQWRGETDFEALLMALTRDKRKHIRQERRRVRDAGVRFRVETGHSASRADWALMAACYARTYAEHHSTPYLNEDFFVRWAAACPEAQVLFIAEVDGEPVATSLCARQGDTLYGRYWGALAHIPCLHFEACYYQPLEWGIAHGIRRFEGGAQGEHKQARALEPVRTRSLHRIADPRFARAIEDFLRRERAGMADYAGSLTEHSAYRAGSGQAGTDLDPATSC
ncbi:MAG: N-acetyltransferase [Rhodocyclaceae bacterium]|nr:N-acetyltransferase [Rhodocyclaceae bacterium]